jgi:hypothetical protein
MEIHPMESQYAGNPFRLIIEHSESGYAWSIELSAQSQDGQSKLGYRANGPVDGFAEDKFIIQVRDKDRPVWTSMPLNHRKDIRNAISQLVIAAFQAMKDLGH